MNRRVAELLILAVMIVVALIDVELFTIVVAVILIPLLGISMGVWIYLSRKVSLAKQRDLDLPSFFDRAKDAGTLALIAIDGAILGVIVLLRALEVIPAIPREISLVGVAWALVLVSVPAIGWLQTWHDVWAPRIRAKEEAQDIQEEDDAQTYQDDLDINPRPPINPPSL